MISEYNWIFHWLIVAGNFDLTYAVTSLSIFSAAPREGNIYLSKKMFGYLKISKARVFHQSSTPDHIYGA